ncbi:hypothetical protein ACWD48_19740 [Streptomyces sp. NPDC002519]
MTQPLTNQQLDLDAIEALAANLYEYADQPEEADTLCDVHVPAMADEIRRLRAERDEFCKRVDTLTAVAKGNKRHVQELFGELQKAQAALEQIRHLHKDSPMGPCPVCIDADAAAAGGDGLVPYPCPTGRLAGAQDCEPPHVRAARYTAAGNEMAASLVRDGFGDDEIADMLGPGVTDGEAAEPTQLRWGLDDVMWGDDDTTTVLLSGPTGEPYWLELDPERAAVLRRNLAGPDGELETGTRQCGHDDYHDAHEWADRPGVWCPGVSYADDEPAAAGSAAAGEDGGQ